MQIPVIISYRLQTIKSTAIIDPGVGGEFIDKGFVK